VYVSCRVAGLEHRQFCSVCHQEDSSLSLPSLVGWERAGVCRTCDLGTFCVGIVRSLFVTLVIYGRLPRNRHVGKCLMVIRDGRLSSSIICLYLSMCLIGTLVLLPVESCLIVFGCVLCQCFILIHIYLYTRPIISYVTVPHESLRHGGRWPKLPIVKGIVRVPGFAI
jgi:hypothetical protein